jgi:polyisoprenoid-binding protein YceI
MGLADGRYTLGPAAGKLLVKTARTGLGSRAGHDLTIEVTRWQGSASVDTSHPGNSSVTLSAEVDSFEVREGTGGVKPLTNGDRAEIKKIVREKILRGGQHPAIRFQSREIQGSAESFNVVGDLTIAGTTRPITVRCRAGDSGVRGSATVVQSEWGIRPYTAFFGALKVRDAVEVTFDLVMRPEG